MESEKFHLEKMTDVLRKEIFHQYHLFEVSPVRLKRELNWTFNNFDQRLQRLEREIFQLKEDVYHLNFHVDEKGNIRKELMEELVRLQSKTQRAKEINLVLQKNIRRAKKTKNKLPEEVGRLKTTLDFLIFVLDGRHLNTWIT